MDSTFTLLDLDAQADAVAPHIRGCSVAEKLAWLKQHGRITRVHHPMLHDMYSFTSSIGIRTVFTFADEGQVYIVGDHTTRPLDRDA